MSNEEQLLLKELEEILKTIEGNNICADCFRPSPTWASINLGVFICLDCAAFHRAMGTHISKVKSTKLDRWTRPMVEGMKKAGNRKANRYWERNLPAGFPRPYDVRTRERFIRDKYELGKYKGTPAPIPATTTTASTTSESVSAMESTPAVMATATTISDANAKGSDGIVNGRRRRRNPNGMTGSGVGGGDEDTMDIMANEHPVKPPKPPSVQEQALNIAIMQGEINMFQNLTLKGSSSSQQSNQNGNKKADEEEINLLMMDNDANDNSSSNNNNNVGNGNDNTNTAANEQELSLASNGDSSISADIQSLVQPSNTDILSQSQPAKPTLSTADIMAAYNQPQMQMFAPAYYVNNGAAAHPPMQYPGNVPQQYQQQFVPEQQLQQIQQIQQMQQMQQMQQQFNNHAQPLSVSPILIDSHQGNGNLIAEYSSQQPTESAFGFLGTTTTPIVTETNQNSIDPLAHLEGVKQEIQQIENQLQAANELLSKFDQIKQDLLVARGNIAKVHGEIEKIQGNKLDVMSSDAFQSLPDSASIVSLRKELSSKASNLSLLLEDFYQKSSTSLQKST